MTERFTKRFSILEKLDSGEGDVLESWFAMNNNSPKCARKSAGFQSLSQFNRVFKKLAGKSPTQ
jgi:AraC-like DNA-binding protein